MYSIHNLGPERKENIPRGEAHTATYFCLASLCSMSVDSDRICMAIGLKAIGFADYTVKKEKKILLIYKGIVPRRLYFPALQ